MKKILFGILLSILFVLSASVSYGASAAGNGDERLIVKFKSLTPGFYRDRVMASFAPMREGLSLRDTYILKVPKGTSNAIIQALKKNLSVEYVEVDSVATALEIPDDPGYPNQWGLTKIKAGEAWDVTHGSSDVDIAVADTGINSTHPDLSGKIVLSVNCTVSGCPVETTTDTNGHGTHVAGIASAITGNGLGGAGVSWEGRLMSVKALDDGGSGYYSWIANGIIFAADNGAEVINLSLGGTSSSSTLLSAINYAWNKGVVVAAAAGNDGRSRKLYPAYYSNSIAVAATDSNDKKASFSNYGNWVDVAAPGVNIFSAYKNDYANLSGTSMATPFVSGLAALLFGQNPGWSNAQVRNRIESTADGIPGTGTYWVHGRINACEAVGCASVAPTPTATATPSPIPTSISTQEPTLTPTATSSPESTPSPSPTTTPTPTPTPKPWWCVYVPNHTSCI